MSFPALDQLLAMLRHVRDEHERILGPVRETHERILAPQRRALAQIERRLRASHPAADDLSKLQEMQRLLGELQIPGAASSDPAPAADQPAAVPASREVRGNRPRPKPTLDQRIATWLRTHGHPADTEGRWKGFDKAVQPDDAKKLSLRQLERKVKKIWPTLGKARRPKSK